jgi:hypothetical protein
MKNEPPIPGIVINVDEAVVRTATIEVRMMVIDKHRVTLSLFRQFQKRDFLDRKTGHQRGIPWGLVNYFWPGCDQRGVETRHLHVLWQDGTELYRDCVFAENTWVGTLKWEAKKAFDTSWKLAFLAVQTAPDAFRMEPQPDGRYKVYWKGKDGWWRFPAEAKFDNRYGYGQTVSLLALEWLRWGRPGTIENYGTREAPTNLREELDEHYRRATPKQLWDTSYVVSDEAKELESQAVKLLQQWNKEYQALLQLEQLFIAG